SSILHSHPNQQRLNIAASDQIIAVTGRSGDVEAWLDGTSYSTLQYNDRTDTLMTRIVAGEEMTVPNPQGSDLWIDEYSAPQSLRFAVDIPEDYSLMVTTETGVPGLLKDIQLSWSLDNSTPWAGPAFLTGGILIVV